MDIKSIDAGLLTKMFIQGTLSLDKDKEKINGLNVFPVPDGDTGTNMTLTMQSAIEELSKKEYSTVAAVSKAVSKGSLMGARGNSGVILSQIFRGFAKGIEDKEVLSPADFARGLKTAASTAYKAVLKPVEGTILTVMRLTAEKAEHLNLEDIAFHDFFKIIIAAANEALKDTPNQLEVLRQAGVVDAGGMGFISILNGFNNGVLGREMEENIVTAKATESLAGHGHAAPGDITFQYCTEFIIKTPHEDATALRDEVFTLGDSMVFVQDEDLVKVHVHTNNPGIAIEAALRYGDLVSVKIDNMKEQHENILFKESQEKKGALEKKKYGFIAVAMGEGLKEIFENLGVDHIIFGGQTMNPSTEDIMAAMEEINAEHVFILPNNPNIIMAANQARELSRGDVTVLPTRSIPQGISALVGFNEELGVKQNEEEMLKILRSVKTLQITYSVRDTNFDSKAIKKDDILGILDGEIVCVEATIADGLVKGIEKAIDEDTEIIAIYYGEEVDKAQTEALVEKLQENYPDTDFEIYYGGQPLYYYLVSLE
ncbi:MAG: hypothetical protein AVO33_02860 [delta proteobacterium ML8_F1]|nr:MAG: hypothetical protein AVO33_02860 [delta proteobacterium ML8_F1]